MEPQSVRPSVEGNRWKGFHHAKIKELDKWIADEYSVAVAMGLSITFKYSKIKERVPN